VVAEQPPEPVFCLVLICHARYRVPPSAAPLPSAELGRVWEDSMILAIDYDMQTYASAPL